MNEVRTIPTYGTASLRGPSSSNQLCGEAVRGRAPILGREQALGRSSRREELVRRSQRRWSCAARARVPFRRENPGLETERQTKGPERCIPALCVWSASTYSRTRFPTHLGTALATPNPRFLIQGRSGFTAIRSVARSTDCGSLFAPRSDVFACDCRDRLRRGMDPRFFAERPCVRVRDPGVWVPGHAVPDIIRYKLLGVTFPPRPWWN